MLESVVLMEFSRAGSGYRGKYWGTTPVGAPVPLAGIELGHSVRFEIPELGVFDGEISGETMKGTLEDAQGGGSFRLEKQLAWDDPRLGT